MQCPHCSNLLMRGDTACPTCGLPVAQNQTRSLLSNGLALAFGGLMLPAVLLAVPPEETGTDVGMIVTTLFVTAALGVGKLIGWVIGAFVSD